MEKGIGVSVEDQLKKLKERVRLLDEQLQRFGENEYKATGRLNGMELNECSLQVENCYLEIQQLEELLKRTEQG